MPQQGESRDATERDLVASFMLPVAERAGMMDVIRRAQR
jgi:hypothetical protein